MGNRVVLCCGENVLVWLLISNLSYRFRAPPGTRFSGFGITGGLARPALPSLCQQQLKYRESAEVQYFYFLEADDAVFLDYSLPQVRVGPHAFRLKTPREEYLSLIFHRSVHIGIRRLCVKPMLNAHDLSASRRGTVNDLELSVQAHVRPWVQHPTTL
jgi:hypothetical protein